MDVAVELTKPVTRGDNTARLFPKNPSLSSAMTQLTHCGRVTQICVFTLKLCGTGEADLRF